MALLLPPGCRESGLSVRMFSGHAGLLRCALIRELARVSTAARRQVQPNAPFRSNGSAHICWSGWSSKTYAIPTSSVCWESWPSNYCASNRQYPALASAMGLWQDGLATAATPCKAGGKRVPTDRQHHQSSPRPVSVS